MAEDTAGGGMGEGEDLYASGADSPETPDEPKPDEGKGDEGSDSEEAILPKSILAGKEFNVGDEVVLKITAMHDGQISVKYAPAKPDGDGGDKETSADDQAEVPAAMGAGGGSLYD